MRLAAFDLSLTGTGFALSNCDGAEVDFGTVRPTKGLVDCPRMEYVSREVLDLARGADLVLMEDVAFSKNKSYAKEIAGLAWVIRLKMWKAELPYILVQASTLKKFCTGSGKAEKNLMLREVFRRFGIEAANDNEADAAALCFLGRALLGEWQPTMEAQREVMAGLRKVNAAILESLSVLT